MNLRQFRKDNGLTQEQLGEYIGMKKSFVSKIENGKERIAFAKFEKLLNNDRGWKTDALLQEEEGGLDCDGIISRLKDFFHVRTDTALAEALGIAHSNIYNWRNRDEIPLNRIVSAAKGIDLNYLIWGNTNVGNVQHIGSFIPAASMWRREGDEGILVDYYTKEQMEAAYLLGTQATKE